LEEWARDEAGEPSRGKEEEERASSPTPPLSKTGGALSLQSPFIHTTTTTAAASTQRTLAFVSNSEPQTDKRVFEKGREPSAVSLSL
jgi:hypothetical protein